MQPYPKMSGLTLSPGTIVEELDEVGVLVHHVEDTSGFPAVARDKLTNQDAWLGSGPVAEDQVWEDVPHCSVVGLCVCENKKILHIPGQTYKQACRVNLPQCEEDVKVPAPDGEVADITSEEIHVIGNGDDKVVLR